MNWLDADHFAVWGMGVSGVAAANLLARRGKHVVLSDPKEAFEVGDLEPGVRVAFGGNVVEPATQVLVVSPGLMPALEVFKAIPSDLPVVSEIDLAYDATETPFVGITGTDGKTTVTSLIEHVLRGAGVSAVAAGNIGTPLCDVVDNDLEVIVAEVSAFQLWSTHHFRAAINVFTNIAGDHLDYFDDFEMYIRAKRRLVAFSEPSDVAVFNRDDAYIRTWAAEFPGDVLTYGSGEGADHWGLSNLVLTGPAGQRLDCRQGLLRGRHNALNFAAVAAACTAYGLDWGAVSEGLRTFKPLPNRIESVGWVDDVEFINDSKATNAHAALAGIQAIDGPLVVIAGGVDKGLDLNAFVACLAERTSAVVLIGDLQQRLGDALRTYAPNLDIAMAPSMERAVALAAQKAKPGSSVILSPAASSFDMFTSYGARGQAFRDAVGALSSSGD